jgi:hypothetical protein
MPNQNNGLTIKSVILLIVEPFFADFSVQWHSAERHSSENDILHNDFRQKNTVQNSIQQNDNVTKQYLGCVFNQKSW